MSMKSNWYAVYTKPRWEKKVAFSMSAGGLENYCPLNKVVRKWSDRKKIVEEPLFTSYVFVRITARQLSQIQQIDGVVNFVYWLGKPAVIRDSEIELIKRFLNEHMNVKVERSNLQVNDKIKILNGPFMEMEGNIVEVNKRIVKVSLASLRFTMSAEVQNVQLI
jgi:transcription antitermination factor NusG